MRGGQRKIRLGTEHPFIGSVPFHRNAPSEKNLRAFRAPTVTVLLGSAFIDNDIKTTAFEMR
jgi:hypothetical protein